ERGQGRRRHRQGLTGTWGGRWDGGRHWVGRRDGVWVVEARFVEARFVEARFVDARLVDARLAAERWCPLLDRCERPPGDQRDHGGRRNRRGSHRSDRDTTAPPGMCV